MDKITPFLFVAKIEYYWATGLSKKGKHMLAVDIPFPQYTEENNSQSSVEVLGDSQSSCSDQMTGSHCLRRSSSAQVIREGSQVTRALEPEQELQMHLDTKTNSDSQNVWFLALESIPEG